MAFVAVVGIVAVVSTNVEYWNWYEFPSAYVAGCLVTQIMGYLLVGLLLS